MMFRNTVLAGGLLAAALSFAAPAQADTAGSVDQILNTLDGLGISSINPGDAAALGQSLCPMLADRGQNTADIAAKVSDALGKPLGVGPMFTGAAISFLCPRAVENVTSNLANGTPLLPIFGG